MKTRTTLLALSLSALLILLCGRKDTLYDPKDREAAHCYALLSDTVIANPSLGDTSHLATCDTIHTKDSVVFIGIVTPADADLKSVKWDFGDGKEAQEGIAVYCYAKGGVYTGIFTIEDKVGITLSDTVVVHVNTPPQVTTLVSPANGARDVDPKDTRGIRFQWTTSDPDTGDSLQTNLYISADSLFLQPSATDLRAAFYDYVGNLNTLKKYYWRIVIADKYGWTDTSNIYSFTTKDPNASGGILQGYAFYQGWNNHRGIKIIVKAPEAMERTAVTNDSGYYLITSIDPRPNYVIIAMDTVKSGQFVSDTTHDTITMGVLTIADTLVLKDPFKPVIVKNQPQGRLTVRRPRISASFSDRGSGILVSSAEIVFNDSNVTSEASVTDSGIQWTPSARLPDDTYRIAVIVEDSAGNAADTLKWAFTVDAMSLSILTPDTTVRINDTFRLHCRVGNVYSAVEEYRWDFDGDGIWDDTITTADSLITYPFVYTSAGTYSAVLYARDDSGMVKTDTVKITVHNNSPIILSIRSDTTISINDSVLFTVIAKDDDGWITEMAWDFDGNGTFDFTAGSITPCGYRYSPAATYHAVVRLTDDDGKTTYDTVIVTVVQDTPDALIQANSTVKVNVPIMFTAGVTQQFGSIVIYSWDDGKAAGWDDSGLTKTTFTSTYTEKGTYRVLLYVRDDDNNWDTAGFTLSVTNDDPVVSGMQDDTISINDAITFTIAASDPEGIKEYWWKFGDGTPIVITTGNSTTHIFPTLPQKDTVIVTVVDNFNGKSSDTAVITVSQDAPQIVFISGDTILDYGGMARCSVYVQQQFGQMDIAIDTANDGHFKVLGGLDLNGGKASSFSTGAVCMWDSVKVRITDDDGNVVISGFKVDIRPRPLVITSIDSTLNTITVNYSQSEETDFVEYRIYRNTASSVDTASDLWATVSGKGTVSYTTSAPGYAWEPRYYRVYQRDSEGLWSAGSNVVYGNIINSPPTTPVITFPANDGDTVWADDTLRWTKCTDLNGHPVQYMIAIKYPSPGYSQCDTIATQVANTFIQLREKDTLGIKINILAYDSFGDSSAWSAERPVYSKPLVKDIDGNVYHYVTIGTQVWLVENLKTTKYNDGSAIPNVTDGTTWSALTTPAYCWYNSDQTTYKDPYGALYNWYVVNSGKLAPAGWHVPTDSELTVLTTVLGGESVAGGKLKETGTTHWNSPNTGATNETHFSALPGGLRSVYGVNGRFDSLGNDGYLWSTTLVDTTNNGALSRRLRHNSSSISQGTCWYFENKECGFSVRCLKGDPVPPTPSISSASSGVESAIITWDPVYSAASYNIYYAAGTVVDKSGTKVTGVTSPQTITGLIKNIQYAFAVSAVNAAGESGLSPVQTLKAGAVADADGNVYHTVVVGTQEWFVENLKTTKYSDGSTIPLVTDGTAWSALTTPAYCWYNNDQTTYKDPYSALYNWYAVNSGKLAPAGWHMPTDSEWILLTTYLGGESVAGGKLKEAGTTHWNTPNTGATNETGFTALPSGARFYGFEFIDIGVYSHLWSTTMDDTLHSWRYDVSYSQNNIARFSTWKYSGIGVRCLKGDPVPPVPTISALTSGDTTAVLSWDPVYNATSYNVYYQIGSTVNKSTATKIAGATSICRIGGLTNGTQYAFAISAVNAAGESGLSPVKTTTPVSPVDIDGNVYHTVIIGTQVWTVENLRTTRFNDGTEIPLVTDDTEWSSLTTPGYCWYNNTTDVAEHEKWGALYNWYAVNTGKLAPAGWHVPTDEEWTELENYLIANGYNYDGTTTGNKIAKSMAARTDWSASTNTGSIGNDLSLNNSSGFSAHPGGIRVYYNGTFEGRSNYCDWWSATEFDGYSAYRCGLHVDQSSMVRGGESMYKDCGFSVRLVRD